MALGGGKYEHIADMVMRETQARAVIVVVLGGNLGEGFTVQGTREVIPMIPAILDTISAEMKGDMGALSDNAMPKRR